jgi:hypothetical protein
MIWRGRGLPGIVVAFLDVIFGTAGVFIVYLALQMTNSSEPSERGALPKPDALLIIRTDHSHFWYGAGEQEPTPLQTSEIISRIQRLTTELKRPPALVAAFSAEAISAKRQVERAIDRAQRARQEAAVAPEIAWFPLPRSDAQGAHLQAAWLEDNRQQGDRQAPILERRN